MKTRVISAIVMFLILGAAIYFGPLTRLILVTFIGCAGIYEMAHACRKMGRKCPNDVVLVLYPLLTAVLIYYSAPEWAFTALFTGLTMFILCYCVINHDKAAEGAMNGLFALTYPGILFSCVMRIFSSEDWLYVCAIAAFATWLCDAFALFGGMAFGKHKLCPSVSPNKTWEGSIIGAMFSLLGGAAVHWIWSGAPSLPICMITALIASTMGQFGDLSASLIKRGSGIKDYSNIIPGHGGIMDRMDSLLFSIPTTWLLLKLFTILGII